MPEKRIRVEQERISRGGLFRCVFKLHLGETMLLMKRIWRRWWLVVEWMRKGDGDMGGESEV